VGSPDPNESVLGRPVRGVSARAQPNVANVKIPACTLQDGTDCAGCMLDSRTNVPRTSAPSPT